MSPYRNNIDKVSVHTRTFKGWLTRIKRKLILWIYLSSEKEAYRRIRRFRRSEIARFEVAQKHAQERKREQLENELRELQNLYFRYNIFSIEDQIELTNRIKNLIDKLK
jgi:hypothetical protein